MAVKASVINMGLMWTAVTTTVGAVLWMFSTFASAADVQKIEYRLLKQEIRDIRRELKSEDDPRVREYLEDDLQDAIDELCLIAPEDRECESG